MFTIVFHTSLTQRTKEVHVIEVSYPDSTSLAASVLLFNDLRKQDRDYIETMDLPRKRIEFSRTYLRREQKLSGTLYCRYCGVRDLIIEEEGMIVSQRKKATLDHIVPVSKGGARFDTNNVVVCCGFCNCKKGTMSAEEFKATRKK